MPEYAVIWDGRAVTLPSPPRPRMGERDGFIQATDEALVLVDAARGRGNRNGVPVEVRLVPRPDNDYNEWAVSIAAPPGDPEETLDERHLGYLFDSYLEEIGVRALHELARYSDGEIRCTAYVSGRTGELRCLALPAPAEVRRACATFLGAPSTPRLATRPTLTDLLGLVPYGEASTATEMKHLSTFTEPQRPVGTLEVSSRGGSGRGRARSLSISEGLTGRHLGQVVRGILLLEDERDRPAVLSQLEALGIPVAQPTTPFGADLGFDDAWPAQEVPNAWTWHREEGLDLRSRDPEKWRSYTTFAQWNPTTRVLFVEDSALVGAACAYVARLGCEVSAVKVPERRWQVEREFRHDVRRDLDLRPEDFYEPRWTPLLWEGLRSRLPDGLVRDGDVRWRPGPVSSGEYAGKLDDDFALHEPLVRSRSRCFPEHQLSGLIGHCRLCGSPAAEFAVPGCTEPVCYCQTCLDGTTGVHGFDTLEQAALGLRLISEQEFAGAALLETQLDEIRLDPGAPIQPEDLDPRLVARFAIRRKQWPWTRVLAKAGLLGDGLRTSRGTIMEGEDGHLCLSMQEKAVDDFLHRHGIAHDREPLYPHDRELNPNTLRRADWLLADGTLVEMWGMPDVPAYAAKMLEKQRLAQRNRIRLVGLTAADLTRLPVIFKEWIGADVTVEPTWQPPSRARKPKSASTGDARGNNGTNAAARRARLDRCQRAVDLQRAGVTRAGIAAELGLGAETVKMALRDGKFYADPDSDPERFTRAAEAADARERGLSKAQFHSALGLSAPKAIEAWRDADVLFGDADPGGTSGRASTE